MMRKPREKWRNFRIIHKRENFNIGKEEEMLTMMNEMIREKENEDIGKEIREIGKKGGLGETNGR